MTITKIGTALGSALLLAACGGQEESGEFTTSDGEAGEYTIDRDTGEAVLGEIQTIADGGVGVVAVTHDSLVGEYADRTVELIDGVLNA